MLGTSSFSLILASRGGPGIQDTMCQLCSKIDNRRDYPPNHSLVLRTSSWHQSSEKRADSKFLDSRNVAAASSFLIADVVRVWSLDFSPPGTGGHNGTTWEGSTLLPAACRPQASSNHRAAPPDFRLQRRPATEPSTFGTLEQSPSFPAFQYNLLQFLYTFCSNKETEQIQIL